MKLESASSTGAPLLTHVTFIDLTPSSFRTAPASSPLYIHTSFLHSAASQTLAAMSTITRTLRNLRRVGLKAYYVRHHLRNEPPSPTSRTATNIHPYTEPNVGHRRHQSRHARGHRPHGQQVLREPDRGAAFAGTSRLSKPPPKRINATWHTH